MLKIIALALLLILAAVLAFAATRPDTFHVKRATAIKAPPEKIFPLVNDFKRWGAWSPYENRDAHMKRTYSGTPAGKGSTYSWEGNKDVGAGRMEIVEAAPPGRVAIKLDFTRPFEAHNSVVFTMVPAGDATEVTWDMQGPANYLSKLIGLFIDIDTMVGKDFEAGLANLKAAAEK
jgi:hypothetical protein